MDSERGPSPVEDARVQLVRDLFEAWSYRGGVDAIEAFVHPDMVLHDLDVGPMHGLAEIKPAVAKALAMWPDMDYELDRFWPHDDSVAFTWVMKATVPEELGHKYGQENVGREWRTPGMSYVDVVDGLVVREFDYYDGRGVYRSLGIKRARR